MIEFDSYAAAKACYEFRNTRAAKIRDEASEAHLVIIEGYQGEAGSMGTTGATSGLSLGTPRGANLCGRAVARMAPRWPWYRAVTNALALSRVFCSRHATVIGPTPPGTGVIAPATAADLLA